MNTNPTVVIGILVGFYLLNFLIIKLFHKPQESLDEYGVAGRSLPWYLVCFSYMGGWYVGATYTGWFAFSTDLGLFAQYLFIYSTSSLIIMYLMAKPAWTWGKEYDLETQADLIQLRYGNSSFSTIYAAVVSVISATWLVVEMVTLGLIVSAATNDAVSYELGMILLGGAVILYSLLGGARASSVGAFVQGITFTIVGTATFYYLVVQAYGGPVSLMELVEANKPELLVLDEAKGLNLTWISAILTGTFGGFCWLNIFSRLYMSSSPRETKRAVLVAPIAALLIAIVILWLGLGGRMIPGFPDDAQTGVFWMANQYGGPIALGLVAVFASSAAVSTISANANGVAVVLAKNVFGSFVKGEKKVLLLAKIMTLVLGVLAIAIATLDIPQLITIALALYDCVVQVIVPLLFGMYWTKGNLTGAIAGLVIGVVIAVGSLLFPEMIEWAGGVSGGLIGLAVNTIVYVVCGFVFGQQKNTEQLFHTLRQYDDEGTKWDGSADTPKAAAAYV